ncbi:hypothetical protein [Phnomibacter sp. MR]|uniref:hypothetical protein n=1 Tax=Phnomibacter sp. MR TaxID=3042318 RepID=UPI003A7FA4CA
MFDNVKKLSILLLCLAPVFAQSQATALLLKKNNKTIQRYYPGRNISFITADKMPVNGRLDSLIRDSLFLTYFQLVQVPTPWGTYRTDTAGRYAIAFNMANVGALPRKRNRWFEGTLMTGGLAYTVLNLVNTVRENDPPFGKDNIANIIGGLGTAAVGYTIAKLKKSNYILGKTYRLAVIE